MSDDLFAPIPVRRDTELGRLIIALEVPDCKCKPDLFCMAGERDFPEVCPGMKKCPDCPLRPCGCVAQVDHSLTVDEWAELLSAYDPAGYSSPPPPNTPAVALTKDAQLAVIIARAHSGTGLWHPRDIFRKGDQDFDHLAIQGKKRLRQGDVLASYHEGDSDEEIEEQRSLDRKVDPRDKIALRSLEFDRAAARASANLGKRHENGGGEFP